MKCIYCGHGESKVLDSRNSDETNSIRRRRECLNCGRRFTTYETVETTPVLVIKNDGSRQPFDSNKVKNGIIKACEKRPVSLKQLETLVDEGEQHYKTVAEFGGSYAFQIQQKNDEIKRKYAAEHNVKLLEIPYTIKKPDKVEKFLRENQVI